MVGDRFFIQHVRIRTNNANDLNKASLNFPAVSAQQAVLQKVLLSRRFTWHTQLSIKFTERERE
jgi:hypothetical protein